MSGNHLRKKYESSKIPDRKQTSFLSEGMFYEIEYGSSPIPGVGRFVKKAQKIEEPEKDEIRDLFDQMRDLSRSHRPAYKHRSIFDRNVHNDITAIFYKQAIFMKDFTDNYSGNREFSQYYPYYQMMGYEQLRTYFTWRTEVRKGNVTDSSTSYAFVYIYELLANIGVSDPQEGLEKLMLFWKAYRVYNKTIDKYVLRWLKDYHIYYALPQTFKEFIDINNLTDHYPEIIDTKDNFDLFCAVSRYDIRKSAFYTDDRIKMIKECFYFITNKLRQVFLKNGINFDESIFQATRKVTIWTPFMDALFHPWLEQVDRRIVLTKNEIYICSKNKWMFSSIITSMSGKQLISYIMKQMEVALRKATKYKYRLTADINTVTHKALGKLKKAGLSLESIINDEVMEFYREATRTVVKVDPSALSVIRQEALATQEKLIVPEQEDQVSPVFSSPNLSLTIQQQMPSSGDEPATMSDTWAGLKSILTEVERKALSILLYNEEGIKEFADGCGIMLEVLVDGINEKAMDYIGDNLMDGEFILYEDYKNQVKEMVGL